jgi:hypothetical protein
LGANAAAERVKKPHANGKAAIGNRNKRSQSTRLMDESVCRLGFLQTVLVNETFGFDSDVNLLPTDTFHLGLWFDDPQACSTTPIKPGPFNGEHHAGPLVFMTVPDGTTKLGPLCTEPNTTTTPASCGQQSAALAP